MLVTGPVRVESHLAGVSSKITLWRHESALCVFFPLFVPGRIKHKNIAVFFAGVEKDTHELINLIHKATNLHD